MKNVLCITTSDLNFVYLNSCFYFSVSVCRSGEDLAGDSLRGRDVQQGSESNHRSILLHLQNVRV